MSNYFKVIQVINVNTIRVSPKWSITLEEGNVTDDKIEIEGLAAHPNNEYFRLRLETLLLNKEIDLTPINFIRISPGEVKLTCSVLLDKTDITYYFPEFKQLPVTG